MARYGLQITLRGTLGGVKPKVLDALKQEGFGVLTEIDVQKTLKEKLGEDMEPYLILGACNPRLAHRALEADRSIGLLLPCNVVLRETPDGVEVSILDPLAMFEMVDSRTQAALKDLPHEAAERLRRVVDYLGSVR